MHVVVVVVVVDTMAEEVASEEDGERAAETQPLHEGILAPLGT